MYQKNSGNVKPLPHRIFIKCNEELLISEIKKRPFLFDSDSKDYKKFTIRQKAWEEISEIVQLSHNDCKKRWRSLRDAFLKHLQNADEEKISSWIHYNLLEFLVPYLTRDLSRKRSSEQKITIPSKYYKSATDDDENVYIEHETYIEENVEESLEKGNAIIEYSTIKGEETIAPDYGQDAERESFEIEEISTLDDNSIEIFEEHIIENADQHGEFTAANSHCTTSHNSVSTETTDTCDSDERFLLSCAPTMKRLSVKKNNYARLKIQQILYEIEFDEIFEK